MSDDTIKIMIIDDHPIVRKGLHLVIKAQGDMEVIGEAGSVREGITIVQEKKPDLIILDLTLPDCSGIEFIKKIKQLSPQVKILVLTIHEEEDYIQKVLLEGANGYLLKKAADDELILAIRAIMRGEMVVDSSMTKKLWQRYLQPAEKTQKSKAKDMLSKRQKEILILVARGFTDKQIAEKIHVSVKTVESHKARIKEKLDIVHRSEFVEYALEHNLLDLHG
ncbi:MAG TPA: DNA-binding response regulator [Firmicutes bacterium]|nr:response regulator transcription factor [Bacillota bacterium]HAA37269.1 DNA-binding response regulator [Bacillota bacterium]